MNKNDPPSDAPWTIYTLHFEPPCGRFQHYTGITRADRLEKRMAEHAAGRGARLTARAIAGGSTIFLAAQQPCYNAQDEKRLKHKGNARTRCPFCSPQLEMFREMCVVSRPSPKPGAPAPTFLDFPGTAPRHSRK